ncbi:MAG TPA: glycosyltransferase family 39 protein [bacterium]|nr:glycosyltransferase family 39 protein [bacterium]
MILSRVEIVRKILPFAAVIILAGCAFFFRLGERPLWSSDEGRYAEIPREMLASGDLLTPHLNYVNYFEKPALSYWLTAFSFKVFGENAWAARFPVALLGLLTIAATCWFGARAAGPRAGFFGGLLLFATAGFFLVSRYLVIDGPFTFFFTASLYLFYAGYTGRKTAPLVFSAVSLGGAVLTKGLVGIVLPGLIVAIFLLAVKDLRFLLRPAVVWCALCFAAVTLPWFVAVCRENPSFFEFFFIREHFQRFLTSSAGRKGNILYFVMIGSLFFFPWTFFVPYASKKVFTCKDPARRRYLLFLFIWWTVVLVFFSISKSKLPPYILPMTPPLALLVGACLSDIVDGGADARQARKIWYTVAGGIIALTIGVTVILSVSYHKEIDARLIFPYAVPFAAVYAAGAALLYAAVRRLDDPMRAASRSARALPAYLIVGITAVGYVVTIFAMEGLSASQCSQAFIAAIQKGGPGKVIVCEGYEHYSDLGFYLKKRIVLAGEIVGELRFGRGQENDGGYFIPMEKAAELLLGKEKVYCLLKKKHYNNWFQGRDKGTVTAAETARDMMITNKVDNAP